MFSIHSPRIMANPVTWCSLASTLLILILLKAGDSLKAQQLSHKSQSDESASLDALRVSSLSRSDPGNYHTISARPPKQPVMRAEDDLMNQIGKPLLVAPPPTQKQQQQQGQQQRQQRQLYKQDPYLQQALAPPVAAKRLRPAAEIRQMTTSAPRPAVGVAAPKWIEPDFQSAVGQTSLRGGGGGGGGGGGKPGPAYQASGCRWIPLRDMKSVSFDTGEIIVRDALDQPCYIISIRAYIKFDEDSYFPLRDFRAYPNGAYRIDPYSSANYNNTGNGAGSSISSSSSGGVGAGGGAALASALRLAPVNCSLPDNLVASQLVADFYLFQEEIVLQVNCGYLVLQTRLDTANQLSLTSIAFYQDASAVSRGAFDLDHGARARSAGSETPPSTQTEHLVFSISGGAEGYSAGGSGEQLIVMPMYSRYICQQRVVLTGNNSVQLVIERLEFKRLTGLPGGLTIKPAQPRASQLHGAATTRCPSPQGPGNFSTSLMAPSGATSGDGASLPTASKHSGNKWTSSSAPSSVPLSLAKCQHSLVTALVSASLALAVLKAREFVGREQY